MTVYQLWKIIDSEPDTSFEFDGMKDFIGEDCLEDGDSLDMQVNVPDAQLTSLS